MLGADEVEHRDSQMFSLCTQGSMLGRNVLEQRDSQSCMQGGPLQQAGLGEAGPLQVRSRLHMALPVLANAMQASCIVQDAGCHLRPLA